MTVIYVPPPNLDGVPKAGNAAELRATHDRQARRDYLNDKNRENQYSYQDQYGFLHQVDGGTHTRIALCEPCGRWYQLDRPETIKQRWPRFCDEPCRKKHDRERKRRERTEPREYAHTSFDPGDWLDPEYMAANFTGTAFEPDMYDKGSDSELSRLRTAKRRDVSPEARAQAAAYLDSLVDDYDRCQRAMPIPEDVWGEYSVYDQPATDTRERIDGTVIFEPVGEVEIHKPLYNGDGIPEDMPAHIRERMERNMAATRAGTKRLIAELRRRQR